MKSKIYLVFVLGMTALSLRAETIICEGDQMFAHNLATKVVRQAKCSKPMKEAIIYKEKGRSNKQAAKLSFSALCLIDNEFIST